MNELVGLILTGKRPSDIINDIGKQPQHSAKVGHVGEAILRLLILLGIHPTDPSSTVVPYRHNQSQRQLEPISNLSDRLDEITKGQINSGSTGGAFDVIWRDASQPEGGKICVCSSKIGKVTIKAVKDLEVERMLVQFHESGGYKEDGICVRPETVMAYVLVRDKDELDRVVGKSTASSQVTKDNLNNNNILDIADLDRMTAVLLERISTFMSTTTNSRNIEFILENILSTKKPSIRTRLHQKLICLKAMKLIEKKKKTILIAALPRSGKTYIGAFISKNFKKILVITTRPSETLNLWVDVFKNHRDFSIYAVERIKDPVSCIEIAAKIKQGDSVVAVASIQFFKMNTRDALIGLEWDLVILDEIHEGGSTELSEIILDTYVGPNPIRLMMTATYTKPVYHYNIPMECCLFWDLEDIRLMRSWGEPAVFARLSEKYGPVELVQARDDTYKSGETDETIRRIYNSAPRLGIMTMMMQSDIYDEIKSAITSSPDNVYGFSLRSLFMLTKDGKSFQNQNAVDTFLAVISGSNKHKHYKKGDMSIFARIRRVWKSTGHRKHDEFMTQIWFIPYGQGQLLDNMKPAIISRISANSVLKHFETLTLDAGMCDISKTVASAVVTAKAEGKSGLIILTGNVGSLGVSLPEVDVVFMLHDIESADMTYQQMMRVLTEMTNKKNGIVVDFNVWRVLNTINSYAMSRCDQSDKSSSERIRWCVSNLIDIDSDLWECPESPETVPQHAIIDKLTEQWRKMIEQSGMSLDSLSRKQIDLGEDDQKELDRRFTMSRSGGGGVVATVAVNHGQEKLPSGIVRKSEEEQGDDGDDAEEEEEEEVPPPIQPIKKVNPYEIIASLIPSIALLSGCKLDLLDALTTIHSNDKHRASISMFIDYIYMDVGDVASTNADAFNMVYKLITKYYIKLNDARERYEIISIQMSDVLNNPVELVEFLCQHLKPKELEKKRDGAVYTPPTLIEQMFDKLTLANPSIWSDPSRRFLDPANGIGNFPVLAYHRLMKGLAQVIPNEAERKKHIIENMLYMCELNSLSVEMSRKIFDPNNIYKLNIYEGSYLDLDTMKEWGVERFDVVFGNPPYQPPSNGKKGGKSLWPTFVEKSMQLLKVNGFLVFVHPALWRKPEDKLHDPMFGKQIHYLSIHSKQEGEKVFHATTRYDWYVLQNTSPTLPTSVRYDDGISSPLMISPSVPFIVNHGGDIMEKMRNKSIYGFLLAERSSEGHSAREYIGKAKTTTNIHPLINSSSKTRGIRLCWSSKPLKYQYYKKVIFSNGEVIQPFYDSGKFGTTEGGIFILVDSDADGIRLTRFLKSKLVSYIVGATKWSNFETNKQIFWSIPHPKDLPDNFTDAHVYSYFGLTHDEIGRIEANQRGPGLANYVALEAPIVSESGVVVGTPVATENSYSNMSLAELKSICKEKNIKGVSGKKKDELLQLISNSL